MDRRRFLKGVGLAGAAGVAGAAGLRAGGLVRERSAAAEHREAETGATRYRIDGTHHVLVSRDGGGTWAKHSTFPQGVALRSVRTDALGHVRLRAAYAGHGFGLRLAKGGRNWITG